MKKSVQLVVCAVVWAGTVSCKREVAADPTSSSKQREESEEEAAADLFAGERGGVVAKTSIPSRSEDLAALLANPSEAEGILRRYAGRFGADQDRDQGMAFFLADLVESKARISPQEYVRLLEGQFTGSSKGIAYNAVNAQLITERRFSEAWEFIGEMPVSRWRERETERYFRRRLFDGGSLESGLTELSSIDVPEERERAMIGAKISLEDALSQKALTREQLESALNSAKIEESEKEILRKIK